MQQEFGAAAGGPQLGVIGVGGGGGNAIAALARDGIAGVRLIAANCDLQALSRCPAERIQLGRQRTMGLGAGGKPELGAAAARESAAEIEAALAGLDMLFIAAGMGGGSGTGAAPVIAEIARTMGVLTVGIVTTPFLFEGARRATNATKGVAALEAAVDALVVVPNQNLFRIAGADMPLRSALALADDVLGQSVRSFAAPLLQPGMKGLTMADMRGALSRLGRGMIGFGEGQFAPGRGLRAAEQAIACPLLDAGLAGADRLIVSISGGDDMALMEVEEAIARIAQVAAPDAEILWSAVRDAALEDVVRVAVIARCDAPSHATAPEVQRIELPEIPAAMAARIDRQAPAQAPSMPILLPEQPILAQPLTGPAPRIRKPVLPAPVEAVIGEEAVAPEDSGITAIMVAEAVSPPLAQLPPHSSDSAPLPASGNRAPSLLDRMGSAAGEALRAWRPRSHRTTPATPRSIQVIEVISRGGREAVPRRAL